MWLTRAASTIGILRLQSGITGSRSLLVVARSASNFRQNNRGGGGYRSNSRGRGGGRGGGGGGGNNTWGGSSTWGGEPESRGSSRNFRGRPRSNDRQPRIKPLRTITAETAEPEDRVTMEKLETLVKSPRMIGVLKKKGYTELTDIQSLAYGPIVESKHIIARSRTGTGKTVAFAMPLVETVNKALIDSKIEKADGLRLPSVLVVTPTRELAKQVNEEFRVLASAYPRLRGAVFFGGVPYRRDHENLRSDLDIVVGTPGRLRDLLDQNILDIAHVRTVVLDEADEMLDMGFKKEIEALLSSVQDSPQILLFSATTPPWIEGLCTTYMKEGFFRLDTVDSPIRTSLTVKHVGVETRQPMDPQLLKKLVATYAPKDGRALVFVNTKREADRLSAVLNADAIHGDMTQAARSRSLSDFRRGFINILIGTDVAARGLDLPNVELVIQLGMPQNDDKFVHRSGRTGRAGKEGVNVVVHLPHERMALRRTARSLGIQVDVLQPRALKSQDQDNDEEETSY